jgi:hypothetical protein
MTRIRSPAAVVIVGVLSSALAGWPALLLLAVLGAMAIGAACWVLNDQDRPERLALLIRAYRDRSAHRPRRTP